MLKQNTHRVPKFVLDQRLSLAAGDGERPRDVFRIEDGVAIVVPVVAKPLFVHALIRAVYVQIPGEGHVDRKGALPRSPSLRHQAFFFEPALEWWRQVEVTRGFAMRR